MWPPGAPANAHAAAVGVVIVQTIRKSCNFNETNANSTAVGMVIAVSIAIHLSQCI